MDERECEGEEEEREKEFEARDFKIF